jgi:hypothetical protein
LSESFTTSSARAANFAGDPTRPARTILQQKPKFHYSLSLYKNKETASGASREESNAFTTNGCLLNKKQKGHPRRKNDQGQG